MATVSAAGRVLDPLIIFAGKNFQSTWKGEEALPNTMYGISSNGWMTTGMFFEWFQKFAEPVEERPLVVVYDGHLSHVSVELIELAINEKITLIKLPPHVTDKLQPLDVCCFGPLKREWKRLLSTRINVLGPRESIVDLLCSIWHKALSPKNVMSGFRATGIYPVDRTKYPTERYDPRLVKRYDKWAKLGRPEDIMEDLATSIQTPKKLREAEEETTLPEPEITETETQINQSQSSTGPSTPALASTPTVSNKGAGSSKAEDCNCDVCVQIGPKPAPIQGKKWVLLLAWTLQPEILQPETLQPEAAEKSFQDLVLDKMKGPVEKAKVKRKKIDRKTAIITESSYVDELKRLTNNENEKKEKAKKRAAAPAKKAVNKKSE